MDRSFQLRAFSLVFIAAIAPPGGAVRAADSFEYWPGFSADPSVPTFEATLGHGPGESIVSHAEMLRYFEALERSSRGRMKIIEYARSWEGRRLVYGLITAEENMRRLDAIRRDLQKLADPRLHEADEARGLLEKLPATVWLGYSVHGNEISGTNAALLTAYHLLAARDNSIVDSILRRTIVFIDPLQNPDGRDRFVHNFRTAVGLEPDSSPFAAEHNEPWPNGRTNHYLFDLNRDWFAITQPETRGRVKVFQEWYPLVFVDLHEMGPNTTYYFSPEAVPFNPHLTDEQVSNLEIFGRNNARWFDRYGFDYFTREIFDAFYPGYGASWPSYYGGIAMTYEQASARGLLYRRSDGTDLHFRDAVRHHFIASLSTAEATAENAAKLLEDFYLYRKSAIEEGRGGDIRAYILPRTGDTAAVRKLAALLVEQGVEVGRAVEPFTVAGRSYPVGSYVILLAQPAKRLVRVLLDDDVPMSDEFVREQERRRRKKLPDEIYDVTAWSLPLMYNVECVPSSTAVDVRLEAADASPIEPGAVRGKRAKVAYLAPWGTAAAARLLTAALRQPLRILSSDKPFRQGAMSYPAGSLIFKVDDNPDDLESTLAKLAATTGAEIIATDSSWVDEGVNFGSHHVVHVRAPRVALAWDWPTSGYSAGATRFVLERQYSYPVTPIRTRQLGNAELDNFEVIILPDAWSRGGYASALGADGAKRLKEWLGAGGTLIALGAAVDYLAHPEVDLLAIDREDLARARGAAPSKPSAPAATGADKKAADEKSGRVPGKVLASEEEFRQAIQAEKELPDRVGGVLVRALVDREHWLGAGASESVNVLLRGRSIFTPLKLDKGVNVAYHAGPEELLASGHLWDENRKQLAFKPFVVAQRHGRGVMIGFTADPNFRAYMDGLNLLFVNAVFRGPAHARPLVGGR